MNQGSIYGTKKLKDFYKKNSIPLNDIEIAYKLDIPKI